MVPFDEPAVTVLVVNSNVRHELAGSEYGRTPRAVRGGGAEAGRRVAAGRDARAIGGGPGTAGADRVSAGAARGERDRADRWRRPRR